MNWVGGARNRMRMRDERKQQKEFFEKKRFTAKVAKALATMKSKSAVSQDIVSLNTIKKMHAQKPMQMARVNKIDLDRAKPMAGRKLEHVELSDVSPIKCVSKISLLDAKESKKEMLQNEPKESLGIKHLPISRFKSMWGPGPGNRKSEMRTPMDQILPRKRSAATASSIYALTSESVSLSQEVDDRGLHSQQKGQQNEMLSKSMITQSECEDETPFLHTFSSHSLPKAGETADQTFGSSQYKSQGISDWFSQSSHKQAFQDTVPRKSSLWSGCSFPSQSLKLGSSSPTENLPANFWKQPKPYPSDLDIFASKRRIKELYQTDEPVKPKIKKHSEDRSNSFKVVPDPVTEDTRNDSDSLEILDDEAFNKYQPGPLKNDQLEFTEPMEANAATGSPDLPIMGSRIYRARNDSLSKPESLQMGAVGSELTSATTKKSASLSSVCKPDLNQREMVPQQAAQDAPLDLSVKESKQVNDPSQLGSASADQPTGATLESKANNANGISCIEETTNSQYYNSEEPLALVCPARQQDLRTDMRIAVLKTTNQDQIHKHQNIPIRSPGKISEISRETNSGSCNANINPITANGTWKAKSNYRAQAEKAFSFTKTPLITRQNRDSQDRHGTAKSNDDCHEKVASLGWPTTVSNDCNSGKSCNTNGGERNDNKAMQDRNPTKTSSEAKFVSSNTGSLNAISMKVTRNCSNVVTPSQTNHSHNQVDIAKMGEKGKYNASAPCLLSPKTDKLSNFRKQGYKPLMKLNEANARVTDVFNKRTSSFSGSVSLVKKQVHTSTSPTNAARLPIKSNLDISDHQYNNENVKHNMYSVCQTTTTPVLFVGGPQTPKRQHTTDILTTSESQDMNDGLNKNKASMQRIKKPVTALIKAELVKNDSNGHSIDFVNGNVNCSPVNSLANPSRQQLHFNAMTGGSPEVYNAPNSDSSLCRTNAGGPMQSITGNNDTELKDDSDKSLSLTAKWSFDSNTAGDTPNEPNDTRKTTPQKGVSLSSRNNSSPATFEDVALSPFLIHQLRPPTDTEDFTQQFNPSKVIRTQDIPTQCELLKSATFVHKFTQTDHQPQPVPKMTMSTSVQCDVFNDEQSLKAKEDILYANRQHKLVIDSETDLQVIDTTDKDYANMFYSCQANNVAAALERNESPKVSEEVIVDPSELPDADKKQHEVNDVPNQQEIVTQNTTDHPFNSASSQSDKGDPIKFNASISEVGISIPDAQEDKKLQVTDEMVARTNIDCSDSLNHSTTTNAADPTNIKQNNGVEIPSHSDVQDAPVQVPDITVAQSIKDCSEISNNYTKFPTDDQDVNNFSLQLETEKPLSHPQRISENVNEHISDTNRVPHVSDEKSDDVHESTQEQTQESTQDSLYESAEESQVEDDEPGETPKPKVLTDTRSKTSVRSRSPRKTRSTTRWKPPVK